MLNKNLKILKVVEKLRVENYQIINNT